MSEDEEFKALEDKIYHELMVEYGLEEPEPPKKTVYPLPNSPENLQIAMQSAVIRNQINFCIYTNMITTLINQAIRN